MTTERSLQLEVTDFGPVAHADVELRPFTVFVGPSNTGKTWLATLVYALHRYFATGSRGWHPGFRKRFDSPALPSNGSTELVRFAEQLTSSVSRRGEPEKEFIALTAAVAVAIRQHLGQQGTAIGEEIERCFGVDAGGRLVRKGSAERAHIQLRHALEGVSVPAVHELTLSDETWTLQSTAPDGVRIRDKREIWFAADRLLTGRDSDIRPRLEWEIIASLAREVLPDHRPAFYLPADRTGLMSAHSTVVSALIQSATRGGIRRADPLPPLSGVRGDFLEQLVELAEMVSDRRRRLRRGKERLRRLGKGIEDRILGGAVKVGGLPGVNFPHFTYLPIGWESGGLPLTQASSMVSELAPVVLYLRHVVASGDLLIIDEPESHLHPAMQVAFTRQIAEIVRAGVRIILTTHSEWVLEELGNVVGRSGVTERNEENSGIEPLDTRDFGVWLFESAGDGSGSTVREIALDAQSGLYPSGFETVATALHNDWAEIAGRRGDAE